MITEPKRVQVVKRDGQVVIPDGAIYVGRLMPGLPNDLRVARTTFGNPHVVGGPGRKSCRVRDCAGAVHDRAEAIELYRTHLADNPQMVSAARFYLAGKDLACWCPLNLPCHADELIRIAAGEEL